MSIERDTIEFDVLFVGGGPANLAGAIRLMQLAAEQNKEIEVALIEKGSEIGAHAVSGAILNPIALKELIPDYLDKNCPIDGTVREDEFVFLTEKGHFMIPVTPKFMRNKGFHIVSLSKLTRWMGKIAEEMGVNLFPGFAGREVIFGEDGKSVLGVITDDKGINKDGSKRDNFEPGIRLVAKITVFGEGARGSLVKSVAEKLGLYDGKMQPVYETGVKEVIEVPEENNYFKTSRGNDIHMMGYPLGLNTPGGGFIYEMKDNKIAIGYLTALCYENPSVDPYEMFIRFKHHPFVAGIIKGGKVIEQGARTVSTGGYYTMPKLSVSGALFVGGGASMHNTPGLKGIHISMKSGMIAAETAFSAIQKEDFTDKGLEEFEILFEDSWLKEEIYEGRNFAQGLSKKGLLKFMHLGAQYFTKGRGFIDPMPMEEDSKTLKPLNSSQKPEAMPKETYDGSLYVDKLTGVYLSKTAHREDQPSHIIVHNTDICVNECYTVYQNPCTRFCPGNVYEIEVDEKNGKPRLILNPSNCFHCKTCDIKDPYSNITWTCPEGGDGPGYSIA